MLVIFIRDDQQGGVPQGEGCHIGRGWRRERSGPEDCSCCGKIFEMGCLVAVITAGAGVRGDCKGGLLRQR